MAKPPPATVILCYDGSEDAKYAIEQAGSLFGGKPALVLTVWRPTEGLGSFAWAGATASMVNFGSLSIDVVRFGVSRARGVRVAGEA